MASGRRARAVLAMASRETLGYRAVRLQGGSLTILRVREMCPEARLDAPDPIPFEEPQVGVVDKEGEIFAAAEWVRFGRDDPGAKLVGFCVAPTARGKGLGGLLMRKVLQETTRLGIRKLRLSVRRGQANGAAIALYGRFGFVPWRAGQGYWVLRESMDEVRERIEKLEETLPPDGEAQVDLDGILEEIVEQEEELDDVQETEVLEIWEAWITINAREGETRAETEVRLSKEKVPGIWMMQRVEE